MGKKRKPARKIKNVNEPKLSTEEQLKQEYAYVLRDLRWVFVLAGIMFALLIALNLFLG